MSDTDVEPCLQHNLDDLKEAIKLIPTPSVQAKAKALTLLEDLDFLLADIKCICCKKKLTELDIDDTDEVIQFGHTNCSFPDSHIITCYIKQ